MDCADGPMNPWSALKALRASRLESTIPTMRSNQAGASARYRLQRAPQPTTRQGTDVEELPDKLGLFVGFRRVLPQGLDLLIELLQSLFITVVKDEPWSIVRVSTIRVVPVSYTHLRAHETV